MRQGNWHWKSRAIKTLITFPPSPFCRSGPSRSASSRRSRRWQWLPRNPFRKLPGPCSEIVRIRKGSKIRERDGKEQILSVFVTKWESMAVIASKSVPNASGPCSGNVCIRKEILMPFFWVSPLWTLFRKRWSWIKEVKLNGEAKKMNGKRYVSIFMYQKKLSCVASRRGRNWLWNVLLYGSNHPFETYPNHWI